MIVSLISLRQAVLGPVLWALAGTMAVMADAAAQQSSPTTQATPQSEAGEPRAATSNPAPAAPAEAASAKAVPAKAAPAKASPAKVDPGKSPADRLDLGSATVTGDREQPKVMYIVPWKKPDIGDLSGKPMNSLLDEALAPVDRDEFRREVAYYDAVKTDAPKQGEK